MSFGTHVEPPYSPERGKKESKANDLCKGHVRAKQVGYSFHRANAQAQPSNTLRRVKTRTWAPQFRVLRVPPPLRGTA
jgi:hypothetical protein